MTPGKLASQVGHATVGLYKKDPREYWSCIVLYATDDEFELYQSTHDCYVVTDTGYTEVADGTQTVLAFYEDDPHWKDGKLIK